MDWGVSIFGALDFINIGWLFDAPLAWQFQVILEDDLYKQFEISQLAQNQIATACESVIFFALYFEGLTQINNTFTSCSNPISS